MRLSRKIILSALVLLLPLTTFAQYSESEWRDEPERGVWLGVGLGGAAVSSLAPAPGAGRGAVAGSIEVGYRFVRDWGMGLELGAVTPVSGCGEWQCGDASSDFAPIFNRLFAFGEFRPRNSGLRLRANLGVSRFCYQRHWSDDALSMFDIVLALIDDDYSYYDDNSGAYRCDASRKALGGSVSLGYDWKLSREAPVSVGARLTAEAANFSATPSAGLPAFKHRAVTFTLQVAVN
jgi:hypothetical protein